MENDIEVVEPKVEQEPIPEPKGTPTVEELQAKLDKEIEARRQLTARAKDAEAKEKALDAQLKAQGQGKPLNVEDYIDISASLEGLDAREKAKLAEEHKLTGKPLSEIRKSEDFLLWQDAYQRKVEKEKALKPTSAQPEADRPRKLSEVLKDPKVSREEKEKLMKEFGLYKDPGSAPPTVTRRVLMP